MPRKRARESSPVAARAAPAVVQHNRDLAWLLHPISVEQFFAEFWEKKPLHIKRRDTKYCEGLFDRTTLDEILRSQQLQYSDHLNVVKYHKGARKDLNGSGRAAAEKVWKQYISGATLQFMQPQRYCAGLWQLSATLESFFSCLVGTNAYLTPAGGAQGLAPHWDDIEAFVLQCEGRKHWKLYSATQTLPRTYSGDLDESALPPVLMDVVLEPGDVLYFPRGTIHHACTLKDAAADEGSTHVTISTYQNHSWGALLTEVLPRALELAFDKHESLRAGLPLDTLQVLGCAAPDSERKSALTAQAQSLAQLVLAEANAIADGADAVAMDFITNRLPPYGVPAGAVFGARPTLNDTVKLSQPKLMRVIMQSDEQGPFVAVCHSLANSVQTHMGEPAPPELVRFGVGHVAALVQLMQHPSVAVRELSALSDSEREDMCAALWACGLLVCAK
eukprot:TRINITY_DN14849_c0_g1_i1.p1 TRINITY_DN14849_c0_g1~~TRINITY_DN14849_c0_g1_i1.p1  ORF type:complete len:447 (+),score=103.78 TRINITY_DN14849_c0_g1_i1:82-1422(+)